MNIRFLFLLLCSVFSNVQTHAQLQQIIPPSPSSRQHDKFINYNVSIHNGIPSISIPLYEVVIGKATIPISLNYHASGIKFGQASGDVGVGWVLDPGYRISRTMNGRPDETHDKPVIPDLASLTYNSSSRDAFLTNFVSRGSGDDPALPSPTNYYDGEFDLFTYSTKSGSGNFIIEDRAMRKIRQTTHTNSTISYNTLSNKSIDFFDIKDGDGNLYRFGKDLVSGAKSVEQNGLMGVICPSAWMLTNLSDVNGNSAQFTYTVYQEVTSFTGENLSVHPVVQFSSAGCSGSLGESTSSGYANKSSVPLNTYSVQRINKVKTTDVEVNFFRHGQDGVLDSILVRNASGQRIKKIVFYYSNNNIHKFLDAVVVLGKTDENPARYDFSYNNKNQYAALNGNFVPDYWGYYKIGTATYPNYPDFESYYYCAQNMLSPDPFIAEPRDLSSSIIKVNKNPRDENDAAVFTLNKITYPTGGSAEYIYEPHKYFGIRDDGSNNTKYVGIRVKLIKSFDAYNNETLVKEYKYGANEDGVGQVVFDIAHKKYFIKETLNWVCTNTAYATNEAIFTRDLDFSTNLNSEVVDGGFMGSPVRYEKVVEYEKKSSGSTSLLEINGKTEYLFDLSSEMLITGYGQNVHYNAFSGIHKGAPNNAICDGSYSNIVALQREFYNLHVSKYANWDQPVLRFKTYFKTDGSQFIPVIKEESQYQIFSQSSFKGLKVRPFVRSGQNHSPSVDYYYHGLHSLFEYAEYEITSANKVPIKRILTTYNGGQSIVQQTNLYYNTDFQISKEEGFHSDGSLFTSTFKYPVDLGIVTANDNVSLGLKKLKETHLFNVLIEKVVERKPVGSSNYKLINSIFYTYKTDWPAIDKILSMESATSVTNFTHSYNNSGAIVYDSRYKERFVFDNYDSKGNLLQQHKASDINHSYYWGYKNQYPIAEATNAKWGEIYYAPFEEQVGWTGTQWQYGDVAITYDVSKNITGRNAAKIEKSTAGEKYCHADYWLQIDNTTPTKYKVSGWVYSTGPTVDIYLFMKTATETSYFTHVDYVNTNVTNQWVYVEKVFEVPATIKKLNIRLDNNGGGTVWFDDIRVHPEKARMTTYTYEPLVGMSSQTDVNNRRTHYTYDGFGRLSLVLDHDKNILKKYCYNYQGQQEDCSSGCTTTAPDWQYTTTPIRCKLNSSGQNTGEQEREQQDMNPCSSNPGQKRWVVVGTNTTACPLPAQTIYAQVSYVNQSYGWYVTYADVIVAFYSDATCTQPISVSNLAVYFRESGYGSYGNYNNYGSTTANGSYVVLEYGAAVSDFSGYEEHYKNYYLEPGNYNVVY